MDVEDWNVCPKNSDFDDLSPSTHLTQLALSGYTRLAADTILNKDHLGRLSEIVGNSIRLLNLSFVQHKDLIRKRCFEVLLEISLNLIGMESKRAGFSRAETNLVLDEISEILSSWEDLERDESHDSAATVIRAMLDEMKMVLKGKSMVAKMADEIEDALDEKYRSKSFISAVKIAIETNIYYHIVDSGLSKFGNDSATGLRWVRHLGAVQVSSNPVIAARAFEELPELWKRFENVARSHPEWRTSPEKYSDEIALFGTVTSLLPNVLDFRPIALLSDFQDGMVSIQLNPHNSSSLELSMKDALRIYQILQQVLSIYDYHLSPASRSNNYGRPNVVFKVATSEFAAIELTEALAKLGIGTNNTVTFTVSQEIRATLSVLKGLAVAEKAGIPVTKVYMTNMEGRLEDHLREYVAHELLRSAFEDSSGEEREKIETTILRICAIEDAGKKATESEELLELATSKRCLKTLCDEWFVEAIGEERSSRAREAEADIRLSGIYVTRRVYDLVFNPKVRSKWLKFIMDEFGLSEEKAALVFDSIDLLPSSKRREEDTYLVLGSTSSKNLTNTEFPDHQVKVLHRSKERGFQLGDFENSISSKPDPSILKRLLKIPDFKKAYELESELYAQLTRVGIETPIESGGLSPADWSSFGPTRKTMKEFKGAYDGFKISLTKSLA